MTLPTEKRTPTTTRISAIKNKKLLKLRNKPGVKETLKLRDVRLYYIMSSIFQCNLESNEKEFIRRFLQKNRPKATHSSSTRSFTAWSPNLTFPFPFTTLPLQEELSLGPNSFWALYLELISTNWRYVYSTVSRTWVSRVGFITITKMKNNIKIMNYAAPV